MELFIVIIIVAAALFFCIKSFVKIYKGEDSCGCGSDCSCPGKSKCRQNIK
ncbi:MAG: FeoB-associated Cys-rich membrane protein [Proteobacteria bacterium]|nr:FeoB-associated Cys-rich membrane protein [Pseudomonadota bacterium]MBU1386854.1 FeoB-associated Cys-rich membrane protein [Pseudomonadota bacterium]MBU1541421.1 FeoB-associated Cys-rich membrane protein [Pseudomonadota bacterium]MBU2483085.1 FeoB-associated Cys-rich membrane protein [Pseudomonadota bacterium]